MSAQPDTSSALAELLLQREIEKVVNLEALLLDERRFEEWLELFAEDLHYWMPTRTVRYERESANELSRPDEVAHFDETRRGLEERVVRIRSGMAWAEDPPSRTRHLFTNVMVEPADIEDEYQVRTNFLLYRGRLQRDVDFFVGVRQDRYRRDPGAEHGWLIAERTIVLDQTVLVAKNLSIFF
ncbi:MAG TPA: 3-phenylpropionate/cinnamic acid dioxygenase subunit beta [Pseudonocardia sp.]